MNEYLEDELMHDELPEAEAEAERGIASEHFSVATTNAGQVSQAGHQGVYSTLVVNSSNPVVQLLGRDYQRTSAVVISVDGPVILAATKENAQQSIATQPVSPSTTPQSSSSVYLPAGVPYTVSNGDELWAAMVGSTATRVSVQVSRRLES